MSTFRITGLCLSLVILALSIFTPSSLGAQSVPEPERQKIEALIREVSELEGAKFIRNGKAYDVATAVRFLRGKWKANDEQVQTARDFVDKVASISGSSGKPYLIHFKDGRETTSREFLLAHLKKLEA
ncbi:MAG TPA: DUF5329 family protein [Candidatus Binatia bacterium]|nr:DUF5329 family protein [Candidatus Binatia bacterium]